MISALNHQASVRDTCQRLICGCVLLKIEPYIEINQSKLILKARAQTIDIKLHKNVMISDFWDVDKWIKPYCVVWIFGSKFQSKGGSGSCKFRKLFQDLVESGQLR